MANEHDVSLNGYLREDEKLLLSLEEVVNPKHTALVVVDMQNDFVHGKGNIKYPQESSINPIEKMTPFLVRFIDTCRKISIPIFWIITYHGRYLDLPAYKARMARRKEAPLVMEGTIGANLINELSPQREERLFVKHGYDGFTGNDLDMSLKNHGISTLIMSGTATDVCVDATLKHGFHLGYYIVAGSDIMATETEGAQDMYLMNVKKHYGLVATSIEITKIWGGLFLKGF